MGKSFHKPFPLRKNSNNSKKECHNEKRHFLTPDLKIFHIPVRKPIDDQQCQWKSNSLFLSPKRTKKAPYR